MVNVLVTVGVFPTFNEVRDAIRMSLPRIPEIGDVILPNAELSTLIARKQKEWNITTAINYVRTVAYYGCEVVVMLGGNPSTIPVDFYYDNKIVAGYLYAVPRVGEFVYVKQFNKTDYLYVSQVTYNADNQIVGVYLTEEKQTQDVYVINKSLSVEVDRVYDTVDVSIVHR